MPDTAAPQLPALSQAEAWLAEAEAMNPGPWAEHARYVARAAWAIAARHPALDPGQAYVLGCLHDIGRRAGVTGARHIVDGYLFLHERGYEEAARVCLSHSYPYKHIDAIYGVQDWSPGERSFVAAYLSGIEYTAYDRLVQLCDALALPNGFCLVEKRFVDVVMRYGCNPYTVPKWQATLAIRDEFEQSIGCSVYDLLPGVVENTFGRRNT